MLEEKDLQAIAALMDAKLAAQSAQFDAKIDGLHQHFDLILENEVRPNFKILAEGHETLLQTLAPKNRVDELAEEVSFLKSVVAAMNKEISELKKAI